jgi:hypothetical protein
MSKKDDPYGYLAKYVTKQGADLHFGGTLANVNFSDFRRSLPSLGRTEIVRSANVSREYFHLNYPRRKK